MSFGSTSVLSIARSTVSSQVGEPLLLVEPAADDRAVGREPDLDRRRRIARDVAVRTMLGLILALIRPA